MAQGQDADGGEERAQVDCLRGGRNQFLRDAGGLRGDERREDLGGDRGIVAHPHAGSLPQRSRAVVQGRLRGRRRRETREKSPTAASVRRYDYLLRIYLLLHCAL